MTHSKYRKLISNINFFTKLIFFILIILLQVLDIYRMHISRYESEYEWLYKIIFFIEKMIIALATGFFGPYFGIAIGLIGKFIVYFFILLLSFPDFLGEFGAYYFYFLIIPYALYSILIGIFWKKYHLTDTKLYMKKIFLFCAVQVVSDIISFELIREFKILSSSIHFMPFISIIRNRITFSIFYIMAILLYKRIKLWRIESAKSAL
jgi:hypothetical protein